MLFGIAHKNEPRLLFLGHANQVRRLPRGQEPRLIDEHGVAVRAGHHCAKPLMRRLGVMATTRASFYIYNDLDDVDALVDGLIEARKVFGLSS